MRFTHKIMLMPLMAAFAFIVILIVTSMSIQKSQDLIEQIESEYFQALELGHDLEKLAIQIRHTLNTAIVIDDEDMTIEADTMSTNFKSLIERGYQIGIVREIDLSGIEKTFNIFYTLGRQTTIDMIRNGLNEELYENVGRMNAEYDDLLIKLAEMTTKQKSDMTGAFQWARERQKKLRHVVRLSIFLSLASLVVFSVFTILSIIRPIRTLTGVTEAIAHGNLDQEIDYKSKDEMGRLADSFGKMQSSLKTHIADLETANNDLSHANNDLKAAQAQLVQSEKMASLGRLVAGVAHEFNNPIGAIQSSNSTLKTGISKLESHLITKDVTIQSDEKLSKIVMTIVNLQGVIEKGTHRVANIVKRMKSFARLDEADLQKADIHEIIEDTIAMVSHDHKPGVRIIRKFGEIPGIICYPAKLSQLCLQLIGNANKAVDENGEITLITSVASDFVILQVRDNGVGIPTNLLSKVFDPGFTGWGVGVGVGLGLAICYSIMEEHNGDISIASNPGIGTTVTVKIPMHVDVK
mgnify:CR=1 FL=1